MKYTLRDRWGNIEKQGSFSTEPSGGGGGFKVILSIIAFVVLMFSAITGINPVSVLQFMGGVVVLGIIGLIIFCVIGLIIGIVQWLGRDK